MRNELPVNVKISSRSVKWLKSQLAEDASTTGACSHRFGCMSAHARPSPFCGDSDESDGFSRRPKLSAGTLPMLGRGVALLVHEEELPVGILQVCV